MYQQASVLQGHQLHLWPWLTLSPIPTAPFVSYWSPNASSHTCHHHQPAQVSRDHLGHGSPVISKLRLEQKPHDSLTKIPLLRTLVMWALFISAHLGCTEAGQQLDMEESHKGMDSEPSVPDTVNTLGVSGLQRDGCVSLSQNQIQAFLEGPLLKWSSLGVSPGSDFRREGSDLTEKVNSSSGAVNRGPVWNGGGEERFGKCFPWGFFNCQLQLWDTKSPLGDWGDTSFSSACRVSMKSWTWWKTWCSGTELGGWRQEAPGAHWPARLTGELQAHQETLYQKIR